MLSWLLVKYTIICGLDIQIYGIPIYLFLSKITMVILWFMLKYILFIIFYNWDQLNIFKYILISTTYNTNSYTLKHTLLLIYSRHFNVLL